jgi:hypothetical protein
MLLPSVKTHLKFEINLKYNQHKHVSGCKLYEQDSICVFLIGEVKSIQKTHIFRLATYINVRIHVRLITKAYQHKESCLSDWESTST